LDSGLRAIPVIQKEEIVGVISETDLVKTIVSEKRANEIASECEYVELEDYTGKVMEIMLAKNVSRVPVIQNGKLIGVVGTMDMIKLLEAKEPIKDKGVAAEKLQLENVKVKTLMSNPYMAEANTPIDKLKDTLSKSEEVFIQNGSIRIITPKDLLELIIEKKPKRGAYVQITNLGEEPISVTAKVDKITDTFIKKISSMLQNVEFLFIHIERHQKQGKKIKYSVRSRFSTNLGLFVSHSWGWDLVSTMQDALNNLEREITKKHDILRTHGKEKISKNLRKSL
ncbi:MAG: CBS domain-containing protein, partial [Candidatus Aenigmarchaeota archaeon]|nr:CBS domain-containing protein [Candidatus Aenigmarchaeota archaeon]